MTVAVPGLPASIPSRADPGNFPARGNAVLAAIPALVDGMNAQNVENNAISADVTSKHGDIMPVSAAVVADAADINTVAASSGNTTTVAGSNANVNTVAANSASIDTVASKVVNLAAVITNLAALQAKLGDIGGTMSGHLNVIAGATGSQVPRRSEVVGLSGNETVAGIKTFSSSPVLPAGGSGSQMARADETMRELSGAAQLPSWTTAGRPASPGLNDTGLNTDLSCIEEWNGTHWVQEGWQQGAVISMTGASGAISGIPPWATEVQVIVKGASHNYTSSVAGLVFQMENESGVLATGLYKGGVSNMSGSVVTSLTDFARTVAIAYTEAMHVVLLCQKGGTTWAMHLTANVTTGMGHVCNVTCANTGSMLGIAWTWGGTPVTDGGATIQLLWRK